MKPSPIAFRLPLRLQRTELTVLLAALALLAAADVIVALNFASITAANPTCFGPDAVGGTSCPEALDAFASWDTFAENLLWVGWGMPVIVGAVLGAPIVAAEVERGTAQIIWSLVLSRWRWLVLRSIPPLIVIVLALTIVGVAAEALHQARAAGHEPGFLRYDQRGVILPARAVLSFAVAVSIGAWIGRVLPAVLIAILVTVALILLINLGLDGLRPLDAVVMEPGEAAPELVNGLVLDRVAILNDGRVVAADDARGLPQEDRIDAFRVLPTDRYAYWVGLEAAALGVAAAAAAMIGVHHIRRRRPLAG